MIDFMMFSILVVGTIVTLAYMFEGYGGATRKRAQRQPQSAMTPAGEATRGSRRCMQSA